tara:strand:- start:23 stop:400 length:378 start_codon:yes stop_codon:yes gene_type:complete
LKFLNKYDNNLLNVINPKMQPEINTLNTLMSKLLSAFNINSYFDKKTRIKEPLIPGKIIAEIAIAPDRKTKKLEFGLDDGATNEIYPETTSPRNNQKEFWKLKSLILFEIKNADEIIKPKKNPHI